MRTTIYIDEDLYARLRHVVPQRGLNRFITQAVADKLEVIERQKIEQEMKEGYLATQDERRDLNSEWEVVDTEGWPA